jgi:uncharacterized protein
MKRGCVHSLERAPGMATKTPDDPVLKRFRAASTEIYGDRWASVVLFGSRARGDAGPDSDYDVAVFLRDLPDRFAEMNQLADVAKDGTGRSVGAYPGLREAAGTPSHEGGGAQSEDGLARGTRYIVDSTCATDSLMGTHTNYLVAKFANTQLEPIR